MRWIAVIVVLSACDKGVDCAAVLAKAEPILKQMGTGNIEYKQLRDRCRADAKDALVRCVWSANGEAAIGACFSAIERKPE